MVILGSIFVMIMGIVLLLFPEFVYEVTESWKSYSAGEPSKLYIISTRVGGACCVLAGIVGIVL